MLEYGCFEAINMGNVKIISRLILRFENAINASICRRLHNKTHRTKSGNYFYILYNLPCVLRLTRTWLADEKQVAVGEACRRITIIFPSENDCQFK